MTKGKYAKIQDLTKENFAWPDCSVSNKEECKSRMFMDIIYVRQRIIMC